MLFTTNCISLMKYHNTIYNLDDVLGYHLLII